MAGYAVCTQPHVAHLQCSGRPYGVRPPAGVSAADGNASHSPQNPGLILHTKIGALSPYLPADEIIADIIAHRSVPTSIMNKIKLYLLNVNKTKRVKRAYLYGSYARGAAKDWSDIDLAIISPDFIGDMFEERLELMRLAIGMDDRIEPHPFRPEAFNDNQPLASEIRRTGIAIDIQIKRRQVGGAGLKAKERRTAISSSRRSAAR